MQPRHLLHIVAVNLSFSVTCLSCFGQAYKESTGFNQLAAEIGGSLENGAGVAVALVETPAGAAYLPDSSSSHFSGKTITDGSGSNVGANSHATTVGTRYFSNTNSYTPGITDITGYEANDWVNNVLGFTGSSVPQAQNFSVMNHSYIDNGRTIADATELTRRLDFVANRDNVNMVIAVNNGAANNQPQLFTQTYNSIVVGRSDGNHSFGSTTLNGAGRQKPDIVAPDSFTSFSTPQVASAAALLRHKGANMGGGNAIQNEVTKAVLLAGATKEEFPGWSNTSTQPLDARFGAGELNIYNSYKILDGGEFNGSLTEPMTNVDAMGWDYADSITSGQQLFYNLDFASAQTDASLLLTWNAELSDAVGDLDYDTLTLANLDLKFYDSSLSFMGSLVGESISTIDNVEHLYFENLAAGKYTIAVENIAGATDFALGWRFTAVPEPNGFAICGLAISLVLRSRRRSCR